MHSNPEDMPAVSAAPVRSYDSGHIFRGYRQPWPRSWRCLCALGLSTTYSVLLLLASLCVATGVFHVEAPHDAHEHHAHADTHHHASSEAHHDSAPAAHHTPPWPDICNIVQQVFTSTILCVVPLPALGLPPGQALVHTVISFIDFTRLTPFSIRAPPSAIS